METLIDCVLRNLFDIRKDLFGRNSIFSSFEEDDNSSNLSEGFQSAMRSGRILYQRDSVRQYSDYVILKLSTKQVVSKQFSVLGFFNEAFFFTRIEPYFKTYRPVDHLFRKYYNSLLQYNVYVDGAVIVFEDLRRRGYRPSRAKSALDYDHLKLMMRKLGEFHAYSYRARQQDPSQFYSLIRCGHETNTHHHDLRQNPRVLAACASRGYEPLLHDPLYSSTIKKLGLIDRDVPEVYDEISKFTLTGDENNPVHVLCHGDFLSTNVLFHYENGVPIDLKMIDLATWRFASPVVDLALVLYMNTDQRMRDENWDNLIDEYYEFLRNTFPLIKVPSKDSILSEFKKRALFTYFLTAFFLSYLVSIDNNDPCLKEYGDLSSLESRIEFALTYGGEKATTVLTNVFKDMVRRNFL